MVQAKNTEQSRLGRLDDGTWTEVTSLFDFKGHAVPQPGRPPRETTVAVVFGVSI
jgi:hypothetical protein